MNCKHNKSINSCYDCFAQNTRGFIDSQIESEIDSQIWSQVYSPIDLDKIRWDAVLGMNHDEK